jgi:hypothetical protein
MNLGNAARSLADGPERSPLYSFGKGQRVLVIEGAPTQTDNSLALSASVISMLDSLHLAKVVEGDLAWP